MAVGDSKKKEADKPTNQVPLVSNLDYTSVQQAGDCTFMSEAYDGSGGFKNGRYIVPFPAEVLASFERRKQLAFYENFVFPIIRCTIDPVMTSNVKREIMSGGVVRTEGMMANAFLDDVTGSGQNMQKFIDHVITKGSQHAVAYAVMDNVPKDEQVGTVATAIEGRKFPYVYRRSADEVENCKRDKRGKLLEIRFKDGKAKGLNGKEEERFIFYDAEKIVKEKKVTNREGASEYIEVEPPVMHDLGKIPVVVDYFESDESEVEDNIVIHPPFYDIAKINFVIFNRDSVLLNQERKQGNSMLFIHESSQGNVKWGADTYMSIEKDAQSPGIVSFPADLLRALSENIDKARDVLFQMAGQMGINVRTAQVKSADAHAWEFRAEEKNLKRTAQRARHLECEIMDLFKRFSKESFEYHVEYPDNYRPDSDQDELADLDKLSMMDMPPKTAKIIRKHAVMIKGKKWPKDEQDVIEAEFSSVQDDSEAPPIGTNDVNGKAKDEVIGDEIISTPAVAGDGAVQDTALNGAQITSLVDIVAQTATDQIPLESAKAIIQAALPMIDAGVLDKIITPLKTFKPQAKQEGAGV